MTHADLLILTGFAALGGFTFLRLMAVAREAAVARHRIQTAAQRTADEDAATSFADSGNLSGTGNPAGPPPHSSSTRPPGEPGSQPPAVPGSAGGTASTPAGFPRTVPQNGRPH